MVMLFFIFGYLQIGQIYLPGRLVDETGVSVWVVVATGVAPEVVPCNNNSIVVLTLILIRTIIIYFIFYYETKIFNWTYLLSVLVGFRKRLQLLRLLLYMDTLSLLRRFLTLLSFQIFVWAFSWCLFRIFRMWPNKRTTKYYLVDMQLEICAGNKG